MEPGFSYEPKVYYNSLSLHYSSTFTERRAWCIKRKKYVGVDENRGAWPPPATRQRSGREAERRERHSRQNVRSAHVPEEEVRHEFQVRCCGNSR